MNGYKKPKGGKKTEKIDWKPCPDDTYMSPDDYAKVEWLKNLDGTPISKKDGEEKQRKTKEKGLSGPGILIGENGKAKGITDFKGKMRKEKSKFEVKKEFSPNKEPYSSAKKLYGGKNSYITGEGLELITAKGISGESFAITLYHITTKKSTLANLSEFDALQEITIENVVDKMLKDKFTMKVNYVKVVDELLRKRYKVIVEGKTKTFDDVVKDVMHRHWKPYTTSKEDKESFHMLKNINIMN